MVTKWKSRLTRARKVWVFVGKDNGKYVVKLVYKNKYFKYGREYFDSKQELCRFLLDIIDYASGKIVYFKDGVGLIR